MDDLKPCPKCNGEVSIEYEKIERKQTWSKRCINCDAYGYKTANDWKYGQRYCFVHKVYINKPGELVCANWTPTD